MLARVHGLAPGVGVVDSDAVEPGGKICLAAELADGAVRRQKYFLGGFRGIVIVAEHAIDQIEDHLFVAPHQNFEGVCITALDPADEGRVADRIRPHRFRRIRRILQRKVPNLWPVGTIAQPVNDPLAGFRFPLRCSPPFWPSQGADSTRRQFFNRPISSTPSFWMTKALLLCQSGSSRSSRPRHISPSGVPGMGENSESISLMPRLWAKYIEFSRLCRSPLGWPTIK